MKQVCVVIVLSILLPAFAQLASMDMTSLQRLTSYQRCRYDEDCYQNSFCEGNTVEIQGNCKCKEGYLMNKNRTYYECLKPANIYEECLRDFQCNVILGTASWCSDKDYTCQCKENAQLAGDGQCYTISRLSEICRATENCYTVGDINATCVFGRCQCPSSYHPSPDLERCVHSVHLGSQCDSDENCRYTNATCISVCTCNSGYVDSRDGSLCIKAAEVFGDPCEEDAQCTVNLQESVCIDSNCTCNAGYHAYGSECVRNAKLAELCTSKKECILTSELEGAIDCADGVCKCLGQLTEDGLNCQPLENPESGAFSNTRTRDIVGNIVMVLFICVNIFL